MLTSSINIYAPSGAPEAKFIVFDNLVLDGAGFYPLGPGAHDLRLQRSEVKNVQAGGAVGGGSGAHDIEYAFLHVHHNGKPVGPYGHGFYVCIHRAIIHDCDVHDNLGYGIQIYDSGNFGCSDGTVIYNNKIHHNSTASGTSTGAATLNYGANIQFYNNVVYNGYGGGVGVSRGSTNTQIYNNTFYGHPASALDIGSSDNSVTGAQVKNNIMVNNQGTVRLVGESGTVFATNLCNSRSEVGCTLEGDPAFVGADGADFRVRAESAARNRGTTLSMVATDILGVPRPQEGAPEIGAHEYDVGEAAPAPQAWPPAPKNLRVLRINP